MTINVKLESGAKLALSEARMKAMVQGNEAKAVGMGPWDSLMDKLRGGKKAAAVRELYNSLRSPVGQDARPVEMLSRFHKLKMVVAESVYHHERQEMSNRFTVSSNALDDAQQWEFSLSFDGHPIHESGTLETNPFNGSRADLLAQHRAHEAIDRLSLTVQSELYTARLLRPRDYERTRLFSCAPDFPAIQPLLEKLHSPDYSSDAFTGITAVDEQRPEAGFRAHWGEKSLLLRPPVNPNRKQDWPAHFPGLTNFAFPSWQQDFAQSDFSAAKLQEALTHGTYDTLNEAFALGYTQRQLDDPQDWLSQKLGTAVDQFREEMASVGESRWGENNLMALGRNPTETAMFTLRELQRPHSSREQPLLMEHLLSLRVGTSSLAAMCFPGKTEAELRHLNTPSEIAAAVPMPRAGYA